MNENPKKWSTVLVDFPWPAQGGEEHYRTESLERLQEFPLARFLADDVHVWFWTTNRYLRFAYDYLESQGLTVRSPLTWVKFRLGMGGPMTLRNATEHCLFATKGRLPLGNRSTPTWINAPVTEHSAKPLECLKLIERISPAPRIELFSRSHQPGWDDAWGDQVESTIAPVPDWPVPSDFLQEAN